MGIYVSEEQEVCCLLLCNQYCSHNWKTSRIDLKIIQMDPSKEEDGKYHEAQGHLLTVPVMGRARSMENVASSGLPGWNSRRHSDVSSLKPSNLRRNNYSFDDLFNRCQIHTSMLDFIDDSDNWSHASFDSSTNTEPNNYNTVSTLSLASITADPGSRKPVNQATLDLAKDPAAIPTTAATTTENNHPLHSNAKRGLSHSMILNWVFSKKYPTIKESTSSEGTEDGKKNNVLSVARNVGDPGNNNSVHKFSYRDLNTLAPSNW